MSLICMELYMELLSDAIFSSGNSTPGGEDIALRIDAQGRPFFSGGTFKGLLRQSVNDLLYWTGWDDEALREDLLGALFGQEGANDTDFRRRVIFGDLHLQEDPGEDFSSLRSFTKLDDGVVETGTLRIASCLHRGSVFTGMLFCHPDDAALLTDAIRGIQWVGLSRNRGFGHVRMTVKPAETAPALPAIGEGSWLRYRLRVHSPLAISWLSRSGTGNNRNFTESRSYLPGSTVRGMILSRLAETDRGWFEAHKAQLLRNVQFLNALPTAVDQPQIPTPMGFYQDKAESRFYSVLRQNVVVGDKRARLGQYCSLKDGMLYATSPNMETLLRIRLGEDDKQMFTVRAIAAGTELVGYIHVSDPALMQPISGAFQKWNWLGSKKFAGCGLCSVEQLTLQEPDYFAYSYRENEPIPQELYMLLLSPSTMLRCGESIGIDETQLAKLLGVETVQIQRCATSVSDMAAFNRTWGCSSPSITMYEAGSIFRLWCSAPPTAQAIRAIEEHGIGTRTEEGCGQVLFLRGFEQLAGYHRPEHAAFQPSAEAVRRQARCRWLMTETLPVGLSKSQMGSVQALCEAVIMGTKTIDDLREHFLHNQQREPRYAKIYRSLWAQMEAILDQPLAQTLNCAEYAGNTQDKLRLICDWIDLSRKERAAQ